MVRAVRGAIRVSEDSRLLIHGASKRLIREMLRANAIAERDLVSIIFSLTEDLSAGNPATGLRQAGFSSTPLFCVREAAIEWGMQRVIRALVTWNVPWWRFCMFWRGSHGRAAVPVYLDGAEALRPDLGVGHPL